MFTSSHFAKSLENTTFAIQSLNILSKYANQTTPPDCNGKKQPLTGLFCFCKGLQWVALDWSYTTHSAKYIPNRLPHAAPNA